MDIGLLALIVIIVFFIISMIYLKQPDWIKAPFVAIWRSITPDIRKLKAQSDIPGLVKAIEICHEKGNITRAREAAIALGELGEDAIQPVMGILENSYLADYEYPGISLGRIGPTVVPPLLDAIQKGGRRSRNHAEALKIATSRNPEIKLALKTSDAWTILVKVQRSCKSHFDRRPFEDLMSMIDATATEKEKGRAKQKEETREAADKVRGIIKILQTGSYEERLKACTALGMIGDPIAIPALEKITHVGPEDVELLFDEGQTRRMAIAYPGGRIPAAEKEMLWRSLAPRSGELAALASSAIAQIKEKGAEKK